MDINGLVNHPETIFGRGSLSPQEQSGSDSARSYKPRDPLSHQQSYSVSQRDGDAFSCDDGDENSPQNPYQNHSDRPSQSPAKRPHPPSNSQPPPSKRKTQDSSGESGKPVPARRRALQACEACRTKKSKCDNERPSCSSCVQHGVECVYKGAPFVPVLDAATVVLLEKLDKIESAIAQHGAVLGRLQGSTARFEPENEVHSRLFDDPGFSPTQPRNVNSRFQLPKDCWLGLDQFCSLSFVRAMAPTMRQSLVCDSPEIPKLNKLPNIQKHQVSRYVQQYIDAVHPIHPVVEIATIKRLQLRLDEEGLAWTGEDAIIMQILALGSRSCGECPLEYLQAASKRLGLAYENNDLLAVQAQYLEGLYWHYTCEPLRAARAFHNAATTAYFYFRYGRKNDGMAPGEKMPEYLDHERRLFWECLKMETRYAIDVSLPDSGLASLDLVTLSMPGCDGHDTEPAKQHASRFEWFLQNLGVRAWNALYDSPHPDINSAEHIEKLETLEKDLEDWFTALNISSDEFKPGPVKTHFQFQYLSCHYLLFRPFLQQVIENMQSADHLDVNKFPPPISSRTLKAIDCCTKLVSIERTRPLTNWFSMKLIVKSALLVAAASRVLPPETISLAQTKNTLNGATEVLARTAKVSESATRALQLLMEVQMGLKRSS